MAVTSLHRVVEGRRSQPQLLIEVLQDVQQVHGFISAEAMTLVSRELGVPLIEVSRVAHFYKAFSLKPRGRHVMTFCLGTACHVRGANPLLEVALSTLGIDVGETSRDGLLTVEAVNCLGACALGPVAVVDGVYHRHMTPAKVGRLIAALSGTKRKGGRDARDQ